MNVSDRMKRAAIMQAYDYLAKDPAHNMEKMCDMMLKFDKDNGLTSQLKLVKKVVSDPTNNWYKFAMSCFDDIDPKVMRHLVECFVVNGNIIANPMLRNSREKYGCNVPWAILMDPTSACNLHCTGCWAAEYGNRLNLSFDDLDSIINQGEALGTYFYIYSGGEPTVRKDDLIALANKHPECGFLFFTNGTLIDDAFADEMLRVGNLIPAISVEGFEEATDSRRGKGTYKAVERAMKVLRAHKLPFGVSCCYTSANVDVIGSERYFDWMVNMGAKFAWLFTYMPIGTDAVPALIATADQRAEMFDKVRAYRSTKPIFTMDFWNDGQYVDGCIAGGRCYLHINANGDVEPCAFIHYADHNIHTSTLLEALQGPLFMQYHANQPFNKNLLRPCPVLDNPGRLTVMVEKSGAKSTDLTSPETAKAYCDKCVPEAKLWAVKSDELWKKEQARIAAAKQANASQGQAEAK